MKVWCRFCYFWDNYVKTPEFPLACSVACLVVGVMASELTILAFSLYFWAVSVMFRRKL